MTRVQLQNHDRIFGKTPRTKCKTDETEKVVGNYQMIVIIQKIIIFIHVYHVNNIIRLIVFLKYRIV